MVFPPSPTAISPERIIFRCRSASQRAVTSATLFSSAASRSSRAFWRISQAFFRSSRAFCRSSHSFLRFSRSSSSAWYLAHSFFVCPGSWQCQHPWHSSPGCLSFSSAEVSCWVGGGTVDLLESFARLAFSAADSLLFQVQLEAILELADLQSLCHGQHPLLSRACLGIRNGGPLLRIATPCFNPLHNEL